MKSLAWVGWLAMAVVCSPSSWAQSNPDTPALPESSESVLAAAFSNRYAVDTASGIELVMRNSSGSEQRRRVQFITKMIDERLHSIARLTKPEYLRGMTILTIEQEKRNHDAFIFLPSMGKVRRVTTAQKGDAFFGSDLVFEDLERKEIDEFELEPLEVAELGGEAVYLIWGKLIRKGSYARARFAVAQSDNALLEVRFYKPEQESSYRVITAARATMIEREGHVLPTRMMVIDEVRGTRTEVLVNNLQINPPIKDRVFTVATLEQERKLPIPAN
jgi:hypothetical protein